MYGNEGYDLYPNEEMNLEEVASLFFIFNNDNEDFSIQISLLQYDGTLITLDVQTIMLLIIIQMQTQMMDLLIIQ